MDIKKMRKVQFIVLNCFIFLATAVYLILGSYFALTISQLNLGVAIFLLIIALIKLFKRDVMASFIPALSELAAYEREKMGIEWDKLQKANVIMNFFLSGLFFLQYFLNSHTTEPAIERVLLLPMVAVFLVLIVALNLSLFFHMKKVDKADSTNELVGYAKQSNAIGFVAGIGIAIGLFGLIIFLVALTNNT